MRNRYSDLSVAISTLVIIAVVAAGAALVMDSGIAAPPDKVVPNPIKCPTKTCQTIKAVCKILAKGGNSQGSGTVIDVKNGEALILSCKHVCERKGNQVVVIWKMSQDSTPQPGVVVAVGEGDGFPNDLGLIIAKCPKDVKPVKLASKFDPYKKPFVAVGHRGKFVRIATSHGVMMREGELIWNDSPFIGGMSGGALFNCNGEIVGVVVASDMTNYGISVPAFRIHQFLDKYRKGVDLGR